VTALEKLENAFGSIELNSLSDKDLSYLLDLIGIKEAQIRCTIIQRKHCKTHFHPTQNN